jgi:hypothetical protein
MLLVVVVISMDLGRVRLTVVLTAFSPKFFTFTGPAQSTDHSQSLTLSLPPSLLSRSHPHASSHSHPPSPVVAVALTSRGLRWPSLSGVLTPLLATPSAPLLLFFFLGRPRGAILLFVSDLKPGVMRISSRRSPCF